MADIRAKLLFDVGELYADSGDFTRAIDRLKASSEVGKITNDSAIYFRSQNLLLQIYIELEDNEKIHELKNEVHDQIVHCYFDLGASAYQTLSLCAGSQRQWRLALGYMEKSFAAALLAKDKFQMCECLFGLANIYYHLRLFDRALQELERLKVFFEIFDLPRIKILSQILHGRIFEQCSRHAEALDIYLQCFKTLKQQKSFYFLVKVLLAMGRVSRELNDHALSENYLQMAAHLVDPENLKSTHRQILKEVNVIKPFQEVSFDLIFENPASVLEKSKGRIDFGKQHVLFELLRTLAQKPGEVISKEELVHRVWKQAYVPRVHNNKVYVTMTRLKRMIEPDCSNPHYIFRARDGYFLSKTCKVLL